MPAITLLEVAAASVATPATNKNSLFFDTADGLPKYKTDAGAVVALAAGLTAGAGVAISGSTISTNVAQNSQSTTYTLVLGDANKHLLHPSSDNNPRTFTIDSNANVAYPIGTCITFINLINTLTIAITSDTMIQAITGSTGSRTLSANGIATAIKIGTTSWFISGSGLA